MSIITKIAEEKTQDELNSLGNTSDNTQTSGAHDVTIEAVYETTGPTWSRLNIDMRNSAGEAVNHTEFLGTPKDDSQAEIDKAEKSNNRVAGILNRLCKITGLKDIKSATSGATASTNDKDQSVTTFPKFKGKKLVVITTTEVQPDKTEQKAYANQVVDTMKFLDKDGKDGMGRERKEVLGEAAKTVVAAQYGKENIPAVAQKVSQLKEAAMGVAPAPQPAAAPIAGMPTATAPAAAQQDI